MLRYRLILLLPILAIPSFVNGESPTLEQLRKKLSEYYLEPEPHLVLSKFYLDKGDPIQAFLISEHARRSLFPRNNGFDRAFDKVILGKELFDNTKEAETALLKKFSENAKSKELAFKLADLHISRANWDKAKEYLHKAIQLDPMDFLFVGGLAEVLKEEGKNEEADKVVKEFLENHPESVESFRLKINPLMRTNPKAAREAIDEAIKKYPKEGEFVFNSGVLHQNENELKEAKADFIKASELAKDSAHIQAWTGRFFLKVQNEKENALKYYLRAYFIDPHFRDTEYVESRIRILSHEVAEKQFEKLAVADKSLEEILADSNPIVITLGLNRLRKNWDPKYAKTLVQLLGHDDEAVRAEANEVLKINVDEKFDGQLRELLNDKDTRKRGLAGYIAVKRWGADGISAVKPWLKEKNQLLRFDAVSALLIDGGEEGKKIALNHAKDEKNPVLRQMLESTAKKK
jgi:tetratricopeptide (TPR) repeat protein